MGIKYEGEDLGVKGRGGSKKERTARREVAMLNWKEGLRIALYLGPFLDRIVRAL